MQVIYTKVEKNNVSAVFRSEIVRAFRGALLGHMFIGVNRRVAGVVHPETTKDLTIGQIWVCLDANIRSLRSLVKHIKCINIPWSKFWSINIL